MASSSLSQESLDRDDFDISSRRSRAVRVARGRAVPPNYSRMESLETTDDNGSASVTRRSTVEPIPSIVAGCEHNSPTRLRVKDKQRCWPVGHSAVVVHKAKPTGVKDKRKLREKRRSSGLVHLHSTESTGDSVDEQDKDVEALRCTGYNEIIDADNPQTPEEERKSFSARSARNKSPSDLDADLEDNQDYDSTVSQSEANSSRTPSTSALQTVFPATLTSEHNTMASGLADSSVHVAETVSDSRHGNNSIDGVQYTELKQLLMKEREENQRLHEILRVKDHTIATLESKIAKLIEH